MTVFDNFLSEDEENSLMKELDPYMKKLRYEFDHWDDVCLSFLVVIPKCVNWNYRPFMDIGKLRD